MTMATHLAEGEPLRHVLRFLARRDVARLVVVALEQPDASLANWLLLGDAYESVLDEPACLHVAVGEGCWRAALTLAESIQRARQPVQRVGHSVARITDPSMSLFDRVVAVLATVPVVFPAEVAYRAADRGDVPTLQWLHKAGGFKIDIVMRRAARTRQWGVLEWLVGATDGATTCGLRMEDSGVVEASCWMYHRRHTSQVYLFVVTNNYGVAEASTFVRSSQSPDQFEFYPLADIFAETGDLASLENVLTLPNSARFFTRDTILKAAAAGHLDVVQWLVERDLRQWSIVETASHAARNGHLSVLQWLFQFPETQQSFVLYQAIEAGQLETSRWLWQHITRAPYSLPQSYPLWKAAVTSSNPDMLTFVHNECNAEFSPLVVTTMVSGWTRKHVEFVVDKYPASRKRILLELVASYGTFDAMVYMVEECRLWSHDLLTRTVASTRDAAKKVEFVLQRAASGSQQLGSEIDAQVFTNLQDLFGIVLAGGFDVAMQVLKHTSTNGSAAEFDSSHAYKSTSHPDYLDLTKEDLITPRSTSADVSASQIDGFVAAFIEYRPAASRAVKWLPQLAVRINSISTFEWLEHIGHPEIYTDETRACIIKFSRNARFMVRLLAGAQTTSVCEPTTVQWAARYALIPVLAVLCRQAMVLGQAGRFKFLEEIMNQAMACGHPQLQAWVRSVGCEDLGVDWAALVEA